MLNILIADDDLGDRKQLRRALERSGLRCDFVETETIEDAIAACGKRDFDCAIVDYCMPGLSGLDGIGALHEGHPFMPIIIATGQGDETIAAEAMKRGAADYIAKGATDSSSLRHAIDSALEKTKLKCELARQRDELETFASVLAHDLKAPLAAMQSFAELIKQGAESQEIGAAEIRRYCQLIIEAGKRMETLIRSMGEYTKADATLKSQPVAMSGVVDDALENLYDAVRKRGAKVTHGYLPTVRGDAAQLTQLLQNLIANAIKYCDAVPAIHIAAQRSGDAMWRFAVTDNGSGIPAEGREDLFKPFKRLHDPSKYPGSGIGLATCKKVVERHGGTIWCESEEGDGATFFFTLPGANLS